MQTILIKNATIVNEGNIFVSDILLKDSRIERIDPSIGVKGRAREINAEQLHLLPGVIDDQVHFREPGLTHKATIETESKAAIAGGVTSFMEMPNTDPQTLTQKLLQEKYEIGRRTSYANYSFFMGASNDNIEEVLKTDKQNVCGIKVFMGSSTGNMLVDNEDSLEKIFSKSDLLIAIHSENEKIVRQNLENFREQYGDDIPMRAHPQIRDVAACYTSTDRAIKLANKYGTRLHVLHISTAEECELFNSSIPLIEKKITAEVCVHHLTFDSDDYEELGRLIKCNPAIKDSRHKIALWKALGENKLDIIATDHAPHTWEEKQNSYLKCPSGIPLIQHSLLLMLEHFQESKITLEKITEKMSHAVADCFKIRDRGYIRESYKADLVMVDLNRETKVSKDNILYKCGWSPFEGKTFHSEIKFTFLNGQIAYENNKVERVETERLMFH